MTRPGRRSSGLSMAELMIAVAFLASLVAGLGAILTSMIHLADTSRANLAASEGNRVALERISNALRGAAADSLSNFDMFGVATSPQFRTATGMVSGVRTLSTVASLQWQPTSPVRGVVNPGEVILVRDGVPMRLAARVPAGGFTVTRRGDALLVHVDTFAATYNGVPSNAAGDALVRLRD